MSWTSSKREWIKQKIKNKLLKENSEHNGKNSTSKLVVTQNTIYDYMKND